MIDESSKWNKLNSETLYHNQNKSNTTDKPNLEEELLGTKEILERQLYVLQQILSFLESQKQQKSFWKRF